MSQNVIDRDIDVLQETAKNVAILPKNANIGQVFKVKSISEDGIYTMEPATLFDAGIRRTTISVKGYGGYSVLYRFGQVVCYAQTGDFTTLAQGWTQNAAVIPTGYRPASLLQLFTKTPNVQYQINANGTVNIYNYGSAITSAQNGGFSATWITTDSMP